MNVIHIAVRILRELSSEAEALGRDLHAWVGRQQPWVTNGGALVRREAKRGGSESKELPVPGRPSLRGRPRRSRGSSTRLERTSFGGLGTLPEERPQPNQVTPQWDGEDQRVDGQTLVRWLGLSSRKAREAAPRYRTCSVCGIPVVAIADREVAVVAVDGVADDVCPECTQRFEEPLLRADHRVSIGFIR